MITICVPVSLLVCCDRVITSTVCDCLCIFCTPLFLRFLTVWELAWWNNFPDSRCRNPPKNGFSRLRFSLMTFTRTTWSGASGSFGSEDPRETSMISGILYSDCGACKRTHVKWRWNARMIKMMIQVCLQRHTFYVYIYIYIRVTCVCW